MRHKSANSNQNTIKPTHTKITTTKGRKMITYTTAAPFSDLARFLPEKLKPEATSLKNASGQHDLATTRVRAEQDNKKH